MMKTKKSLKEIEILVAGVIRNGEKSLESSLSKLLLSLPEFKKVHVLVIESDSSDSTLNLLENLSERNSEIKYISLGNLRDKLPKRTERLALARNRYLSEFRNNVIYRDCEYIVVSDLDGVTDLVSRESFQNCFMFDESIRTANQLGPYYDIWALRHHLWSPNDCWEEHRFYRSKYAWPEKSLERSILSRMITLHPDSDPIEVESAFGGLAVYPRTSLINAEYIGISESGAEICEHVSLNKQIRKNGFRIVVDPKLINTGFTDHTKEKKFLYKIKRFVSYPIKYFKDI